MTKQPKDPRSANAEDIRLVMNAVFKHMGIDKRMKEMYVINHWSEIMGVTIAKATERIDIYNRVLFLKINSSVIKRELTLLKSNIIDVVNSKAGASVIDDVIIK